MMFYTFNILILIYVGFKCGETLNNSDHRWLEILLQDGGTVTRYNDQRIRHVVDSNLYMRYCTHESCNLAIQWAPSVIRAPAEDGNSAPNIYFDSGMYSLYIYILYVYTVCVYVMYVFCIYILYTPRIIHSYLM